MYFQLFDRSIMMGLRYKVFIVDMPVKMTHAIVADIDYI